MEEDKVGKKEVPKEETNDFDFYAYLCAATLALISFIILFEIALMDHGLDSTWSNWHILLKPTLTLSTELSNVKSLVAQDIHTRAFNDSTGIPVIDPLYWSIYSTCSKNDMDCNNYIDLDKKVQVFPFALNTKNYQLWITKASLYDFLLEDSYFDRLSILFPGFLTQVYPLQGPVWIPFRNLTSNAKELFLNSNTTCVCHFHLGIKRRFFIHDMDFYFDPVITQVSHAIIRHQGFNNDLKKNFTAHTKIIMSYLDRNFNEKKKLFTGEDSICFQYCLFVNTNH